MLSCTSSARTRVLQSGFLLICASHLGMNWHGDCNLINLINAVVSEWQEIPAAGFVNLRMWSELKGFFNHASPSINLHQSLVFCNTYFKLKMAFCFPHIPWDVDLRSIFSAVLLIRDPPPSLSPHFSCQCPVNCIWYTCVVNKDGKNSKREKQFPVYSVGV